MGRFARGAARARYSTAPNARYGPADIARCVAEASVRNRNVASAASAKRDTMKKCGLAPDRPCGEWLRLSLRGISPDEAIAEFDRFAAEMIAEMKSRGLLDGKLDMGIDFHNILRYDKKPGPELIRGGDKKSKTKAFYETYATVQCIVGGKRLVLGMLPHTPGDDHAGAVRKLLDACGRHGLKIGTITLDRGFYSEAVFRALKESGHRWLMPCPNSTYVKEALSDFEKGLRGRVSEAVITSSSRECGYDMVIVERKVRRRSRPGVHDPAWEKHIAFATNDPSIDVDQYSKRWGIETGYRQIEDMRARTRTRGHGPRVMCMALTMMLFNAWIVADALHKLECGIAGPAPATKLHSALTMMATVLDQDPALTRAAPAGPSSAGMLRASRPSVTPAPCMQGRPGPAARPMPGRTGRAPARPGDERPLATVLASLRSENLRPFNALLA